ncbi:hypothetical protein [Streptomyces bambusae]|uniref:Chitinase n=1 Tax=Streptomyces bambusae TaxID=1550616 RepID=A0ABS6ZDX2_9ACTN|nr:hypothetical protein [Streptomyces bambusae]MBW5485972.1 hypothetical protein [Streptomyces bambusae]
MRKTAAGLLLAFGLLAASTTGAQASEPAAVVGLPTPSIEITVWEFGLTIGDGPVDDQWG